jgi:ribosomal-protein-alanine N-acetyltransferase
MKPPEWRPPILRTERLLLRGFELEDTEPLFEHSRNPKVTQYTLWEAHRTIADTTTFVRDYAMLRYREGMAEPYAITLLPNTQPIGACGCFWVAKPHLTMELGYWLAEPFWGRGYVAEACRALLTHAFAEYLPERMQARVIEGNTASERVLAKLGFQYEGTLRSALLRRGKLENVRVYSMLRSEWKMEN